MIPADFIVEWRGQTRWATDEQVEQDLVLSRALVAIFEDSDLADMVALRGGTALHKLVRSNDRAQSADRRTEWQWNDDSPTDAPEVTDEKLG